MKNLINWNSIRAKLLAGYGLVFIATIVAASIGIHSMVRDTIETNIENELKNSTAAILGMVQTSADTSIKNHLRAIAQNNRDIAESYYRRYQAGELTEAEAKRQARQIILAQRIGKTGYLYCVDSKGVAVVHREPGVEGRNFSYREFVQEQMRRKEGYLTYDWRNPGELEPRPKALYMTYFAPWDWIISASSYREEFSDLVNVGDFRDHILGMRFGKTGYSYVIDGNENIIIHPSLQGRISDLKDPELRQTARKIVRQKQGKITYEWKNPGEEVSRTKVVILNYIPDLDWVVASSGYVDEIYAPLHRIRNIIAVITVVTMVFVLLITLWISSTITSPLRTLMRRFATGATGDFSVRMGRQSGDEIGRLSEYFNTFMAKLQEYSDNLHREITDHRKSLEALRQSEERFRSLAENSPDIIVRLAADGSIGYINPAVEKVLGYSREELIGRNFTGFVREEDAAEYVRNFTRMWKGRETIVDYNGILVHKDGSLRYFIFCGSTTANAQGEVTGIEGILKDITERKHLESQLQQSQRIEAVGTLAGGIAHDFNNILTAIRGSLDLCLLKLREDDPVRQHLRHIEHAAVRASDLTRQLLLFSRRQPMETEPVNLNASVQSILTIIERLIGEDISIKVDLAPELHSVMADRTTIEQVIMNIVINARDAMPKGGSISIRTENRVVDEGYVRKYPYAKTGRHVCLTVEDSGEGMSSEVLKHIFEPFFTTKEQGRGTGLGLAVVYGIVKQHRGWINVASKPGEGTTFRIYFPAVSIRTAVQDPEIRPHNSVTGKGEKILVVEDDADVLRFTLEALEAHGYTVFPARSAAEAVGIFEAKADEIGLVFSDVVLPDRNGVDLVEGLIAVRPDLRVLVTSGYMDETTRSKLIRDCRHPFIPKPYTLHDMLRTIRDTLDAAQDVRRGTAA